MCSMYVSLNHNDLMSNINSVYITDFLPAIISFTIFIIYLKLHRIFNNVEVTLTPFDSFYFTASSLLMIGNDYSAINAISKIFTIIIGVTSILCLTILISYYLSVKKPFR